MNFAGESAVPVVSISEPVSFCSSDGGGFGVSLRNSFILGGAELLFRDWGNGVCRGDSYSDSTPLLKFSDSVEDNQFIL